MARAYPKFTYEDYLLLPEDKRYELIEGDLIMVPAPGIKHQEILLKLARALADYVEAGDLGKIFVAPCDVILSKFNVVQPDIIFVSNQNISIITEANIIGPPDLVIEVLSSNQNSDIIIKKKLYAKYEINEYWIVNPENQSIEVMVLDEKGYKSTAQFYKQDKLITSTFPELSLTPAKIF